MELRRWDPDGLGDVRLAASAAGWGLNDNTLGSLDKGEFKAAGITGETVGAAISSLIDEEEAGSMEVLVIMGLCADDEEWTVGRASLGLEGKELDDN